jgi:competence protein ComEA
MRSFNIREAVSRLIFWGQNIRYLSRKHYVLTVIMFLLIVATIFTLVFLRQRKEIERKENIARSFYEMGESGIAQGECTSVQTNIEEKILVHICGEVVSPGVYEVEDGSRIIDLMKTAGGETEEACIDSLNLAQVVFDGQRIYVPSREEVVSGEIPETVDTQDADNYMSEGYSLVININTAAAGKLESLPGIGPVTAEKIIQYREKYGSFKRKEDLMNVSGIGPKKFEQVKDLIDV